MAYAPPDPKRIAYEQALAEAAAKEIAFLDEQERERKRQIEDCYTRHIPSQIANKAMMVHFHHNGAARVRQAENEPMCWERIGRSRGGRRKGNLYKCLV